MLGPALLSITLLAGGWTPPTVSSISPNNGPTAGGMTVAITGANFGSWEAKVSFGGHAATSVKLVSATLITATVPPGAPGAADVVVTTGGTCGSGGVATLHSGFTYAAPLPAITFQQANSATPQSSQLSVPVTYSTAQTAGDLNVVIVGWNDSTAVLSSVTDTKGNSYSLAVGPTVQSGVASQAIYYAKNIAAAGAGANTVTVRFSVPAKLPDIRILEYAGVDTGSPVDATARATGNSIVSDSGPVATTNADDLLLGANLVETGTADAEAAFTSRILTSPDGDLAEDRVVAVTGSYDASATLNAAGPWIMQLVAFKRAGPSTPTIFPRVAALTFTRTQQFSTNLTSGVTWAVDGVAGGSASSGTISTSGLYSPPNSPGIHTVTFTSLDQSQSASATVFISSSPGVFTHHNDNLRTGQNLDETVLTPANVTPINFGLLYAYPIDGYAYAAPLYVANLNIPGSGFHNVVYVATEHDSVYAFDADGLTPAPLWQVSFINPPAVTTVSSSTVQSNDLIPEIGITGTPVIDQVSGTLYAIAKTAETVGNTTTYVQRLHALDITTGAEKFGGPVTIQASVSGSGDGSQNGQVPFDPLWQLQRPALLLANGVVYAAFGSHGDNALYHGWILGFDATSLKLVMAYNATPNGSAGGIWHAGGGLAADSAGDIYFMTGNGTFDANLPGGRDYGDSIAKISPSGAVLDYFTPHDQMNMNSNDIDLGSGGPLLLPDQSGPYTHLLVTAGKGGTIYVVNRDNMGAYNKDNDNQIPQALTNVIPGGTSTSGNYKAPVYFAGSVYFGATDDPIRALQLSGGSLSMATQSPEGFRFPGAAISISASGGVNGVLWAMLHTDDQQPGILYAYDASNLGNELYNSSQSGSRDTLDSTVKFAPPVVVNGKVFVATTSELAVYGLLP
jgi:hypothetical protein